MQKRVLAIHDLSCVGRCSLSVALPILSACGLHASALPTALLSTHTGEFTGYSFLDLTEEMARIDRHLASLGFPQDGVYVGFLGSAAQIALVHAILQRSRNEGASIIIDPAMADQGQLYATYTDEMVAGVTELCHQADLLLPNVTEAALLLNRPYLAEPTLEQAQEMTQALSERYHARQVVMTGIPLGNSMGVFCYDAAAREHALLTTPYLPHVFYGTGDVFASALVGLMLRGMPLVAACRATVDFVYEAILHTLDNGLPLRYGVAFEQALHRLMPSEAATPHPADA